MNPDIVNGIFESVGAYFTWMNAYALWRDRVLRGVFWPCSLFFTAWGLWNMVYYPSLHQWFSFMGGAFLCSGNIAWLIMAIKYRKN